MNIKYNNDGLVPVIIQNFTTQQVIMLGYMNEEAFEKTKTEGKVTFFSRSKQRLWTKGETSGNFLLVKNMHIDCDQDTILIQATPLGPSCHTGTVTCFNETTAKGFLYTLEETIDARITGDDPNSYTNALFKRGINKVAQKVGEEATELVIEAKDNNDDLFKNEAADLLYHLLILLRYKKVSLDDVERVLLARKQ
jgi:phosphoribosyl-ATP pyrophosphohydrolase/phosphoribosyl-AMP cyclohydrolase